MDVRKSSPDPALRDVEIALLEFLAGGQTLEQAAVTMDLPQDEIRALSAALCLRLDAANLEHLVAIALRRGHID